MSDSVVKVTVCQLDDAGAHVERNWHDLVAHVRAERSDLVLLPEIPFCRNFTLSSEFDPDTWSEAVSVHNRWELRFPELQSASVAGTRPIDFGDERYNEGFIWSAATGLRGVHTKARQQCEDGAWECRWYRAEYPDFVPASAGVTTVGFLIGCELWATEQARRYGAEAVDMLLTPRMSAPPATQAWLSAGREAAVLAGAFALSSGRAREHEGSSGCGWIIAPDGETLAMTSGEHPFASISLDLRRARAAKQHSG